MSPNACPHFEGCNAPVCPLNPSVGGHLAEDRVCRLAREAVKSGGPAHVAAYAGPEVASAVLQALPEVRSRWPRIDRTLTAAAASPLKGAHLAGISPRGRTV